MGFFDWSAPFFEAFGDRWSDVRVREIADALRPTVPDAGGRVLDLGGGTGVLSARLAQVLPAEYSVVDPTPAMEHYARKRTGVITVHGKAEAIPLPDAAFDAAVVSDAFHHFPDQDGAVAELLRVVKPGGRLVILEFDRRSRLLFLMERIADPRGRLFTPEELCEYLGSRGVRGTCVPRSGWTYDFIGEVPPARDAASDPAGAVRADARSSGA